MVTPWYHQAWCRSTLQWRHIWVWWRLKLTALQVFVQRFYGDYIKESIKVRITGPLWGESTSDRWFPLTKGQKRKKSFSSHDVIRSLSGYSDACLCVFHTYPTLAREFQGFRVWGKFVFRTLELTDTPTNLANRVKVGHALDQSRSVQSRGPERAHQYNEPSRRSLRTDRRLSRQFWDD